MKDKENLGGPFLNHAPRQSAAASQIEQVQEESKGPIKAKDLFKSGMGNFRCDLCEESFFRKKEYERHRKTAIHKAHRT